MAKPVIPLSNGLPRDLGQLFVEGQGASSPQSTCRFSAGGRSQANLDVAKVNISIEVANYQKAIQGALRVEGRIGGEALMMWPERLNAWSSTSL